MMITTRNIIVAAALTMIIIMLTSTQVTHTKDMDITRLAMQRAIIINFIMDSQPDRLMITTTAMIQAQVDIIITCITYLMTITTSVYGNPCTVLIGPGRHMDMATLTGMVTALGPKIMTMVMITMRIIQKRTQKLRRQPRQRPLQRQPLDQTLLRNHLTRL